VTSRPLKVGALLKLRIASERLESDLEAAGQVVWTQAGSPFRAGICFTGATSGMSAAKWFERLMAAELSRKAAEVHIAANAGDGDRCTDREDPVLSIAAAVEHAEELPAPDFELVIAGPDELTPHLSRLLEFAIDALLAGNVSAAERFLRRAQAVAPGDVTSKLILRRIAALGDRRAEAALVAFASPASDADAG
jgi:hypothetical protein